MDINNQQILDQNAIKPGYQVRVAYSVKANGDAGKPGVFLNFDMVQLVSIDAEIQSGPDPSTVFGQPAQALPMQPGAVATPPQAPAPPAPPAGAPAPAYQPPPAPPQPAPPVPLQQQVQQVAPAYQPDPSFLQPPPGVKPPGQ